jgi:phage shock protein A
MFERLFKIIQAAFNNLLGKVDDPTIMLEQTYQHLQTEIIQLRQAVKQAIEAEKEHEQDLPTSDGVAKLELEAQLDQQKESTNRLRLRLAHLEKELKRAQSKKQMLIARDKAARATMRANQILSKINNDGELEKMIKLWELDRKESHIPTDDLSKTISTGDLNDEELEWAMQQWQRREELTKQAAQLGVAVIWLILNISFLYLIYHFAHLSYPQAQWLITAAFCFLIWVWLRDNRWFFHNAGTLWREMSKDMQNLKSKRKD